MDVLEKLRNIGKESSLDEQSNEVRQAWRSLVGRDSESWVRETYVDYVIACVGEDHYRIPYTRADDGITFDINAATKVEMQWADVTKTIVLEKTDDDRQLAFGWAYVTNKDGEQVTDHSGEFIDSVDLIEDAAYAFNLDYREGDERHTEMVKMTLVESFVSTPEKLEKMGLEPDALPTGWWTGWYVDDPDVFAKIKDGEYPMLSIGGWAQKETVDA